MSTFEQYLFSNFPRDAISSMGREERRKAYVSWWRKSHRKQLTEAFKKWRHDNPEKIKAARSRHYLRRSDHIKERVKKWKIKNSAHAKAWSRNHYITNRTAILADHKTSYAEDPSKKLASSKSYRERFPEKSRQCKKRSVQKNIDYYRMKARQWRLDNPERFEINVQRYSRRLKGVTKNPEEVAWYHLFIKQHSDKRFCAYCGKRVIFGDKIHMDHITPLSLGGLNTVANLFPSCADCNLTKHDKILSEWFGSRPIFYDI